MSVCVCVCVHECVCVCECVCVHECVCVYVCVYVCVSVSECVGSHLSVSSCKKMTPAQKRFTIHRLPNILTIQLKRYMYIPTYSDTHDHSG